MIQFSTAYVPKTETSASTLTLEARLRLVHEDNKHLSQGEVDVDR